VEAVRHFLGFADDSDARVVENCVLAQISYGQRVAAEDHCRRVRLPLRGSASPSTLWRAWKNCVWRRLLSVRCR
jgi:hypothetical protein